MARVTDAEVKEIITTSITTTAHITAANLLVTEHLASKNISDALLKEIERWLAAHFVAMTDPREHEVSVGTYEARAVFEGRTAMGLDHSRYGQQVKLLDPSGTLMNIGAPKALFKVMSEYD